MLIHKKKINEIIKDKFRKFVPLKVLKLRSEVIKSNQKNMQQKKYGDIYQYYIKYLNRYDFIKEIFNLDNYDGYVRPLIMLALYMHGIEDIGFDDIVYEYATLSNSFLIN